MCGTDCDEVLSELATGVRRTLLRLGGTGCADISTRLTALLERAAPIITPLREPATGQLSAEFLIRQPPASYPALLAEVIGPPPKVGQDDWLGYLTAECALAALRQTEVRASLTMLFVSTLCSQQPAAPAIETLNHLLTMSDRAGGAVGLVELGSSRHRSSDAEVNGLRTQLALHFATTAVQILGTWGNPQADPRAPWPPGSQ